MFDTKALHDCLIDNNIGFDMDNVDDAMSVWTELGMQSKSLFADLFHDFVAEMDNDTVDMLSTEAASVACQAEFMGNFKALKDFRLINTYINSITLSKLYIADKILNNHRDRVAVLVESSAEDWMADCIGYNADMMEGQREDAEYARRGERF